MKIYRKIKEERKIVDGITCDKCKKYYSYDNMEEQMEIQEFHSINFHGGYSSVFGDMNHVECDLCQSCLKEMIGSFCRYNNDDDKEYSGFVNDIPCKVSIEIEEYDKNILPYSWKGIAWFQSDSDYDEIRDCLGEKTDVEGLVNKTTRGFGNALISEYDDDTLQIKFVGSGSLTKLEKTDE